MGCNASAFLHTSGEVVDANVQAQASRPSSSSDPVALAGRVGRSKEVRLAQVAPGSVPDGMPERFQAQLQKRNGDLVGASLGNTSTGAVIFSIQEGGILDRWNKSNPSLVMRPGFVIEEVNGTTGYWNVLEEMRKTGNLTIKVTTQPPADAGPKWFEEIEEMARSMEAQATKGPFMLRLQPQDPSDTNTNKFSALPSVRASACDIDQCAICLEDVAPNETLVQLPCNHAFHALCAARWLAQTMPRASRKRQCCPLCCRKVVSTPEGGVCSIETKDAQIES